MIDIGPVGIWQGVLDAHPSSEVREVVAELDETGWQTIWVPETVARDPFVAAAIMLEATSNLKVATGIASIWARDAMTTKNAAITLNEAYDGRFLLGLGVSHHTITEWVRKHRYERPLTRMREYLERMHASMFRGIPPPEETTTVLAALGPRMLALAAELADGAHPYFVPVEHTVIAREALGSGKLLAVEQMVVIETDPSVARDIARQHMGVYLGLPNYANNLIRLGFSESDIADAADKVVDAIVAWGTLDDVRSRVKAHHDAGADHVCVQVLLADRTAVPLPQWRLLAEALL
jgi:probable F420-dependent oxidoreductase